MDVVQSGARSAVSQVLFRRGVRERTVLLEFFVVILDTSADKYTDS
jgi:hypothetical protein